ncbi:MAG: peptidylprolyl isomerase [Colwellia sp.]
MNILKREIPEALQFYLKMKTSLDQFGKIVSELDDEQSKQLNQVMTQALKIYTAVLASSEAKKIMVPESHVNLAMRELKGRFKDLADFNTVLEANMLDEDSLRMSLRNELHCETTLDYISNDCLPMSAFEAEDYYYQNLAKFSQPERRKASHILITVNDDFDENTLEKSHEKMQKIADNITPDNFSWYALRNSECPTAMDHGYLGLVDKGQLHTELDEYLFSMKSNTISEIVSSEVGFHLLWCQGITPEHTVSYKQAQDKIIEQHLTLARKRKQKIWIADLFKS